MGRASGNPHLWEDDAHRSYGQSDRQPPGLRRTQSAGREPLISYLGMGTDNAGQGRLMGGGHPDCG
jgi:hypothetical protein